jgi:TetR/AcrR family transcriptional regulator, transcriptional repressor for nem operon
MARPKKFDENQTLKKALNVFWKNGYAATSMAELTKAMDINPPSLYDTYGDKRNLFLMALRDYQESQKTWLEQLFASGASVKDILTKLLKTMVGETLDDPDRKGCFMVNTTAELANRDEGAFQIIRANEKEMVQMLEKLFRHGQETGEISTSKDVKVLASYFFVVIQGFRIQAAANPDRKMFDGVIKSVISGL